MKKFSVLLSVVLLAVAVVPQAFADYLVTGDKVTVTTGTDRGNTSGGPFKLAVANPAKSIQTFCLETGEYVSINGEYYVQISDRAMAGGETPPGDVISYATLQSGVQAANEVFKAAGVQYWIKSYERWVSPQFSDLSVASNPSKTWTQVRSDLQVVFPGMPSNAWTDGTP